MLPFRRHKYSSHLLRFCTIRSNILPTALYTCDRCYTIDQEVRYIWRRQPNVVSALYIVLQLVATVYFLLLAVQQLMTLSCNVCLRIISQDVQTDTALCRMR